MSRVIGDVNIKIKDRSRISEVLKERVDKELELDTIYIYRSKNRSMDI